MNNFIAVSLLQKVTPNDKLINETIERDLINMELRKQRVINVFKAARTALFAVTGAVGFFFSIFVEAQKAIDDANDTHDKTWS